VKILLVDDDPDLLSVTGFALQQAGFLVVKAEDGVAALEAFEREQPHLGVLDINMPRMNGFELAQKLRERSRIPLIMLTARSEEADVVRALALGADDYLSKPFSPKILIARVKALLRRAGGRRRRESRSARCRSTCRSSCCSAFAAGPCGSRRSKRGSCSCCSRMRAVRCRRTGC
jgi:DNA-binding response OmpR family regulator